MYSARYKLLTGIVVLFGNLQIAAHAKWTEADSSYVATFGKPVFLYDAFSYRSTESGKTELRVFVSFVFDLLQFVKQSDECYSAKYELIVEIVDAEGGHQAGYILQDSIKAGSFAESNSRQLSRRRRMSFAVPPGKSELVVQLRDLETKRHLTRKKEVVVRDFEQGAVELSDLTFVDVADKDSVNSVEVFPNISKTYEDPATDFAVYFEVYATESDSTDVDVFVHDDKNRLLLHKVLVVPISPGRQPVVFSLKEALRSAGQFQVLVRASRGSERDEQRATIIKTFSDDVSDGSVEASDAYLQALKYVSSSEDFEAMTRATGEERQRRMAEFWSQRDPTPTSPLNELRQEYLSRLEFAIRHFAIPTQGKAGWESDRGKIYIIYGPPTSVRRRNMELDTNPYEFWHYDHIGKRFVFLDKSGLGAYRLVHED